VFWNLPGKKGQKIFYMKSILKKIVIFTCYYSGLSWLVGMFLNRKIFCIGYHSIFDDVNKDELLQKLYWNISVNSKDFEKQLIFLKNNGHTFIHFSDLKNKETKKLSKPTIIFFDDGFKDVLVNALPILKKHNIPATIFITTGLIDRTHFLWTLGLRHFLGEKGRNKKEIETEIKKIKKMPMQEREKFLKTFYSKNNFKPQPENFDIFLDWPEVRDLSNNNFEIGSHGIAHQKLTELNDSDLENELISSKKILEEKVGREVETISYPYGRNNEKVESSVNSAGYTFGVSTISGFNDFEYLEKYPFRIKKITAETGSMTEFKVRVYMNL